MQRVTQRDFFFFQYERQIFIYRKSNGQEHEIALAQLFSISMGKLNFFLVEHLLKMIFRNNGGRSVSFFTFHNNETIYLLGTR